MKYQINKYDYQIIEDWLDQVIRSRKAGNELYIRDAARILENELLEKYEKRQTKK